MIEFGAVLLLGIAAILGLLLFRSRKRVQALAAELDGFRQEQRRGAALLETVPVAAYLWRSGGEPELIGAPAASGAVEPSNVPASFAELCGRLDPGDNSRLGRAVAALRGSGTAFSAMMSPMAGGRLFLEGRQSSYGDSVLWLLDATAMVAAEAAQARAEARSTQFAELLDALPFPAWERDGAGALLYCNQAYAQAVDLPREMVVAESRELAPAPRDKTAKRASEPAPDGSQSPSRKQRHVVIAGSRRLLELVEVPGRAGAKLGFATDLTETETVRTELSRHINAHAEVLESIHAAIAIFGADKRLQFYNAGFSALWGLEEEWLAGKPSLDELLERLRENRRIPEYADFRAFKRQQLAMFTSLIEPQQELLHLPDERTLRLSISPHPFGGITFVYEDVTDRLALERSYNTLIEVQRETLDNLFEAVAVFGSDGRLKLHNPEYRTIWGLSEADVAGQPRVGDIIDKTRDYFDMGEDWAATRERIVARVTAQTSANHTFDRRDGSVLRFASVPLPDGNILLTYLDVSDTARVERVLRERNEALETAGRLKSEFIANVSYELRTPLNAIIGFAEILANQYFGSLNARQVDYSRGILDSSHRLLSLINDILDLATIEAGYMVLETRRTAIDAMMQSVLTLTRERARNQNLELDFCCPVDIGEIEADERRLKQALFNLISNAIKFTPAGGTVRIEAARQNDELLLIVSDNGVGIPESDHARVLEKFERGNPQARQSGAGLGLSLVKSLIELHGGRLEIDSQVGRGTKVTCRLPYNPPAASASPGLPELPGTTFDSERPAAK